MLLPVDNGRILDTRISNSTGHDLETMDDLVFWSGRRDGVVGMTEFNRVGDDLALGVTLDKLEAPV